MPEPDIERVSAADPARSGGDDSNADRIRAVYSAWISSRGRDLSGWWELFADDVVFLPAGRGREPAGFTRPVTRKSALLRYFDFIALELDLLDYEIERLMEAQDKVFVIAETRWRIRRTGRTLALRSGKVFWFRDGKVVRFEEFFDTATLIAHISPTIRSEVRQKRRQRLDARV